MKQCKALRNLGPRHPPEIKASERRHRIQRQHCESDDASQYNASLENSLIYGAMRYIAPDDPSELSSVSSLCRLKVQDITKYSEVKKLKPIKSPGISKFARMLKRVREWAAASGMSKDDIPEAIKAVRKKS